MSVLSALAARRTALGAREVAHLHRLLADWQLLADLSFADCLLFAPVSDGRGFIVLGQVRPYPSQTLYPDDLVGSVVVPGERPKVVRAWSERRIVREGDPVWRDRVPVREEAVPVVCDGRVIAVLAVEQNLATARTPSHLELSYMRAAAALQRMIADGTFPFESEDDAERDVSPRVGDGFFELNGSMRVVYASPNAVSAVRRLGVSAAALEGAGVDELVPDDPAIGPEIASGRPCEGEVEGGGAWVVHRFLPIVLDGTVTGAIGLVRDVTELRRRDRLLLVKDATIREIHHRVKNNLQTVASLLRLQARRLGESAARAELEESVRRITSIAIVHETLSHDSGERVDFDDVAERILSMVRSSLARPDRPVGLRLVRGSGELPSEIATPLSLILVELVQNAFEHAFVASGGLIEVTLRRDGTTLSLTVADDGAGLPDGFTMERANLGLQIVGTLVQDELHGRISFRSDGGTAAEVTIPMVANAPR